MDERGQERCRFCGQVIVKKEEPRPSPADPTEWLNEKKVLEAKLATLLNEEQKLQDELETLRESERVSYELRAREVSLRADLDKARLRETQYKIEYEVFVRDSHEISLLTSQNVLATDQGQASVSRQEQVELRKKIERLKIKVEDTGSMSSDVIKEYDDTKMRDEHLSRELEDLEKSRGSLEDLMKELSETLHARFKDGLSLVNKEFSNFFETLFGGGKAAIEEVKIGGGVDEAGEEKESEIGIDISVSLPRKKIKGLDMLSGGERALTSIALLFAMSQVNPPPFLVLDETDAALDEANSRKYGQMLSQLSDKSQLIVVTHNRETMSHASVLYGVTMSSDGVSKLLSIRFDDATVYAK